VNSTTAMVHSGAGSPAQRERRQRILEAAVALASQGGFEQMQMRAVAERADVALGTLYRYFPSKIHLLVCALGSQLELACERFERSAIPGDTAADRVVHVLGRTTGTLQRDPRLTEALTRAFMFADATVASEIAVVEQQVLRMLMTSMRAPGATSASSSSSTGPTEDETAIIRVIGDVWLSSLVQWVTGRASADDVARSLDVAVRLLLR